MDELLLTQTATAAVTEIAGAVAVAHQAYVRGEIRPLIGALLSLVVGLARYGRALEALPDGWDKWVAVLASVLGSIATGVVAGEQVDTILISGLQVGAYAVASWEVLWRPARDRALKRNRRKAPLKPRKPRKPKAAQKC